MTPSIADSTGIRVDPDQLLASDATPAVRYRSRGKVNEQGDLFTLERQGGFQRLSCRADPLIWINALAHRSRYIELATYHSTHQTANAMTAHYAPRDLGSPLTDLSQCHSDILSRLRAFAELPALATAANCARTVATDTLALFQETVYRHHEDEEGALFPAILRNALPGEEFDRAQTMVRRLESEHRAMESLWKKLKPAVESAAKGKLCSLDVAALDQLLRSYLAHASFEELEFLPFAKFILSRDGNHMAALDLSLTLMHSLSTARTN